MSSFQAIIDDINENGPYITTENLHCNPVTSGHIHFHAPKRLYGSHLTFVTLRVKLNDGTEAILDTVDVDKIITMAEEAKRDAIEYCGICKESINDDCRCWNERSD